MRKLMMAVCFALLAGSTLSAQEGGNAPLKSRQEAGKPFAAERKINLRRLKNHSAENEKSFGADFYDIHYQTVAKNLPNVFFRSGTQG